MKIEMPKQNLHVEFDVQKDYDILWHEDENGKKVNTGKAAIWRRKRPLRRYI